MATTAQQFVLFDGRRISPTENPAFSENKSEPVHRWVPWIAGFSATFVQSTLREFFSRRTQETGTVLDPFAGVGTTLVEAIKAGHNAIGFEINPYAALAARVKLGSSDLNQEILARKIQQFRRFVRERLESGVTPAASPPPEFKSRVEFYSPRVRTKVLHCLDFISKIKEPELSDIFRLAFGSVMVSFSNYSYEPSLTTRQGVGRQPVLDADVFLILEEKLKQILEDIEILRHDVAARGKKVRVDLYNASFMEAERFVDAGTIDLIISSPPYLNNYHYVRNTRPQIYWLGLNRPNLMEELERHNIGTFWQTVRQQPPIQLSFRNKQIADKIESIRGTNKDNRVYGGPGWANYVAAYYNDTFRYIGIVRKLLRRRGVAVIVIGNSIIQGVNLLVDQHIAEVAGSIGLKVQGIRLLREKRVGSSIVDSSCRNGKKTSAALYESAVILSKP